MSSDPPLQKRLQHPVPLAICVGLVLFYGVMSIWAASGKSSSYDEPMHALGGWVHRHSGDFRINFEDPPLWQYWATLLTGKKALPNVNWTNEAWLLLPQNIYNQWAFTLDTLYRTPGHDGEQFVFKQRVMMVLLGMGMCAIVALWSWKLGGPIAAIIATALVTLDPNLLGHGALVKNDLPMGLMLAAVFLVAWRAGERLTWVNGLGLAVLVAVAVNVKFSALLMGPMLVILFGLRVLVPIPWETKWRLLERWYQRAAAVGVLFAAIGLFSYIAIWACYGFRYNPSPDPNVRLNTQQHKDEAIRFRFQVANPPPRSEANPGLPITQLLELFTQQFNAASDSFTALQRAVGGAKVTDATRRDMLDQLQRTQNLSNAARGIFEQAQHFLPQNLPAPGSLAQDFPQKYAEMCSSLEQGRMLLQMQEYANRLYAHWATVGDHAPDGFIGLLNVAMDYRLLPSAYLHGVLFVHARSITRGGYLMGTVSNTGWWYYFPMAMLFKTPVASVLSLGGAAVMGVWLLMQQGRQWRGYIWATACLAVPFGIYMLSIMTSNLNIGIRHALCVYPLMYVAAGVLLVGALARWRWMMKTHLCVLGVVLLIESIAAAPDYVAYFNFVFGGSRGGFKLLGDSNLDWGQDLPALKKWREQHMNAPLFIHYFGIAESALAKNESGATGPVSDWRTLPRFYKIPHEEPVIQYDRPVLSPDPASMNGYVAISATELQAVYTPDWYSAYRKLTPMAVLGGTIYVYDLRK